MKVTDHTSGKYYYTHLEIELDDGNIVNVEITSPDERPSYKEIAEWGTLEEFEANNCDGHYERQSTRTVADAILYKLNI